MKTNKNILNNTIALASLESSSIYKSSFMNAAFLPFPTLFPPQRIACSFALLSFSLSIAKKVFGARFAATAAPLTN